MTLLVSLILGLITINVVMAGSVALATTFGWVAGPVVGIIGALTAVVLSFPARRPSLAWAGLIALPAGILGGMDGASHADLMRRPRVEDILVADAVTHGEAGAFTFRDGAVRADLWGKSTRVSRSRSQDFYAAPVVGDSWDDGQPVTVWAVCYLMYDCRKDWTRPYRAGVRPTPPVSEHLGLAIADAEASRGLTSAPGAVMVFWVPSVEQALAAPMDSVWFGVRVWNGTWVVTLLAGSAIAAWRRRSRATPA